DPMKSKTFTPELGILFTSILNSLLIALDPDNSTYSCPNSYQMTQIEHESQIGISQHIAGIELSEVSSILVDLTVNLSTLSTSLHLSCGLLID
ncbi:hypothetical protein BHE74_00044387, partial [Ensete ventricosum]